MEDAAGVVSDQESAAAGPGQCAASHLPEDQDAGGLCSLVLQGFTWEQSTIPVTRVGKVRGPFLTTSVMPLHASSVPISEQLCFGKNLCWFVC